MSASAATKSPDRCPQSKQAPSRDQFAQRYSLGAHRAVTCTCGAKVYVHPRRLDWQHYWETYLAEHNVGVDSGSSSEGQR